MLATAYIPCTFWKIQYILILILFIAIMTIDAPTDCPEPGPECSLVWRPLTEDQQVALTYFWFCPGSPGVCVAWRQPFTVRKEDFFSTTKMLWELNMTNLKKQKKGNWSFIIRKMQGTLFWRQLRLLVKKTQYIFVVLLRKSISVLTGYTFWNLNHCSNSYSYFI